MQSKAATVDEYLASLPADRRDAIAAVRKVILDNLDSEYAERMSYGMIGYCVPHSVHPAGYHCDPKQPLPFAGLASQKGHMSLYLMCIYGDTSHTDRFKAAWKATGKKLDMGKACIRFKKVDDLALDVIGETIRALPARKYAQICVEALEKYQQTKATGKTTKTTKATKPATKSAANKKTPAKPVKQAKRASTSKRSAAANRAASRR